tara:strand:- start:328 stop:528 length:201 start_codon:yes stop_codon:yes gene_type:complete
VGLGIGFICLKLIDTLLLYLTMLQKEAGAYTMGLLVFQFFLTIFMGWLTVFVVRFSKRMYTSNSWK